MSTIKVNTITDANGGSNVVLQGVASPPNSMGFRNRIINGDMRIDQRNNGAAVTVSASVFALDRWKELSNSGGGVFSVQRSTTAPAGFTNSALRTVTIADASVAAGEVYGFSQPIEGYNIADLALGSASASAITVSFWVRSSLTGTFSVTLRNSAGTRSYPATYTVNAANTFEYKTVTAPGETSGVWATDNSVGLEAWFDLGSGSTFRTTANVWASGNFVAATGQANWIGTSGATFYITGVQLEAGSVASPFERRDIGRELMMCQRYFSVQNPTSTLALSLTSTAARVGIQPFVEMRTTPTLSRIGNLIRLVGTGVDSTQSSTSFTDAGSNPKLIVNQLGNFSGLTPGVVYVVGDQAAQIGLTAEL